MIKKIYCIILDAKNFFLSRKMISKVLSFLIFQNYLEIKYMTNRKWKNCVKNELNKMCNMLKWSTMEGDDNHEQFLYIMCESFLLAHSHRILVSPWNYPMGIVHGGCLGKKKLDAILKRVSLKKWYQEVREYNPNEEIYPKYRSRLE